MARSIRKKKPEKTPDPELQDFGDVDEEFSKVVPKKRHAVTIQLDNGTELPGYLFLSREHDRVQDLLNESGGRDFIPFRDTAGDLRLISKAKIMQVIDKIKSG